MTAQKTVKDHFIHLRALASDTELAGCFRFIEKTKKQYLSSDVKYDRNRLIYDAFWIITEATKTSSNMPSVNSIEQAFDDLCADAITERDKAFKDCNELGSHRLAMVSSVKLELKGLSVVERDAIRYQERLHQNIERVIEKGASYKLARSLATLESVIHCCAVAREEHFNRQAAITAFSKWRETKECRDVLSCYGMIREKLKKSDRKIVQGLHIS